MRVNDDNTILGNMYLLTFKNGLHLKSFVLNSTETSKSVFERKYLLIYNLFQILICVHKKCEVPLLNVTVHCIVYKVPMVSRL